MPLQKNFIPAGKQSPNTFKFLPNVNWLNKKKGREIYDHINANKINEIDKWIEQFKNILETQFNQLDKVLLTLKKQKK
jgi:hypothetical protein